MGGQLLGRLWPRDDEERQAAIDAGYDLDRVLTADDLCSGDDVFFSATGVTDGDVLQGVRYRGPGATTESLVMRSRSGTVRRVHARHDRSKLRAITGGPPLRLSRGSFSPPCGYLGGVIAVAGSTGYIGGLLGQARCESDGQDGPVRSPASRSARLSLAEAGCERRPGRRARARPASNPPLAGAEVAYYLVHSMGRGSTTATSPSATSRGAENFAAAAAEAGVAADRLPRRARGGRPKHLASRHETAEALARRHPSRSPTSAPPR